MSSQLESITNYDVAISATLRSAARERQNKRKKSMATRELVGRWVTGVLHRSYIAHIEFSVGWTASAEESDAVGFCLVSWADIEIECRAATLFGRASVASDHTLPVVLSPLSPSNGLMCILSKHRKYRLEYSGPNGRSAGAGAGAVTVVLRPRGARRKAALGAAERAPAPAGG
ncbi:hypothetical protein EVAR_76291_1 [Eumeta japonica]|uniref:Uncharacterized protein n=1 Tax=Eumeta variegata TaxID=151549 RepID=A0A4C1UQD8_EUMVA|nr:hypothetical protein EVAR_76291_1 [Eumeta japonica]